MCVRYLLEGTGLFGGVKVVFEQADLLQSSGHEVQVVSRQPAPEWYFLRSGFVQNDRLEAPDLPEPDVTVATFWTTLGPALRGPGATLHFCQGYEGHFDHNRAQHPDIERAYAHPVPAMVPSAHLGELLRRRFGRPSRRVPHPLESFWRPADGASDPDGVPTILVVGPVEVELKGVATALRAVRTLRDTGFRCRLVRLSQTPLDSAERALCRADEYHHHLVPSEAARVYRGCDLLLAPSREEEGFGLPVLEAMASGVPVVASDVSSFRGFASEAAILVPPDDPAAFAEAARRVLQDAALRSRLRRKGLDVARRFGAEPCLEALETTLRWVLEDRWRDELTPVRP